MKKITCFVLVAMLMCSSFLLAAPKGKKVTYMGKKIYEGQMVGSNIDLSKADYKNLIEPDDTLAYAAILSAPLSSGRRNAIINKFKKAAEKVLETIHQDADTVNRQIAKGSIKSKRSVLNKFNKDYFKKVTTLKNSLEKTFKKFFAALQKKSKVASFKKIKILNFHTIMTKDGFGIAELKGALKSKSWNKRKSLKKILDWDAQVWYNTIYPPDNTHKPIKQNQIKRILIRTFMLIKYAGLKFRNGKKSPWKLLTHNTASTISHGGRILIGVKKNAKLDKRAVTNWLVTGKAKGTKQAVNKLAHFKSRTSSTHKTTFKKGLKEAKVALGNFKNNYAFNVPLGGYGSVGFDGTSVAANGRFGHYLIVINDAPKSDKVWQMAFQLGVEGTEPIFFTKPYACKGHLGTTHKLGSSESISITNSPKWKTLCKKNKTVPAGFAAMQIEIDTKKQFMDIVSKTEKLLKLSPKKQMKIVKDMLLTPPLPKKTAK